MQITRERSDTSDDHETLITRARDLQDNATPSGNAMAATILLKLAAFANNVRYVDIAHQALAQMQPMLSQYPLGFGQWLQALAYALSKPREIALVGEPQAAETQALLSVARDGCRPYRVVTLGVSGAQLSAVPLFHDRDLVDGQAVAYKCDDFASQSPVADPEALESLVETY